jgi:putative endonuclease
MYFVYAIHNKKYNRIYIGQTENLEERLKLHNRKEFKNSYTAQFDGEWFLIYEENVINRKDALKREKQLKSYRGREFIKTFIKN